MNSSKNNGKRLLEIVERIKEIVDFNKKHHAVGTRRVFVPDSYCETLIADCEVLHTALLEARGALKELAAQDSGEVGSTKRSDCMAAFARLSLSHIDNILNDSVLDSTQKKDE